MHFLAWSVALSFYSSVYLLLLFLPTSLFCSAALWRGTCREGNSGKLLCDWSSVFGYGTNKTQIKL